MWSTLLACMTVYGTAHSTTLCK